MTKQHALRIPDELMEAIEERRNKLGLSRNEWIVRALQWAVEQPIRTVRKVEQT